MLALYESFISRGITVALVQEPYVSHGDVRGVPTSLRVLSNGPGSRADIVVHGAVDVVLCSALLTNDVVVACVSGEHGELFVASLYCAVDLPMEETLANIDRISEVVGNRPLLLGLDANAVSALWHSKASVRYRHTEERGELLEEFVLQRGYDVLNEWSEWFTFSKLTSTLPSLMGPPGNTDGSGSCSRSGVRATTTPLAWNVCSA